MMKNPPSVKSGYKRKAGGDPVGQQPKKTAQTDDSSSPTVQDLLREKEEQTKELEKWKTEIADGFLLLDKVRAETAAQRKRWTDLERRDGAQKKELAKLMEKKKTLHLQAIDLLQRESKVHIALHQLKIQVLEMSKQFDVIRADAGQLAATQRHQNDLIALAEKIASKKEEQEKIERLLKEKNTANLDLKRKMDLIMSEINDSTNKEQDVKKNQRNIIDLAVNLSELLADIEYNLILARNFQQIDLYNNRLDKILHENMFWLFITQFYWNKMTSCI